MKSTSTFCKACGHLAPGCTTYETYQRIDWKEVTCQCDKTPKPERSIEAKPAMTAITRKKKRQENDFYATPGWAVETLLKTYPGIEGDILECCAGANDITSTLRKRFSLVTTNDLDPSRDTDYHFDLSTTLGWMCIPDRPDWIITNPPFCHAPSMVPLAYDFAKVGLAMFLRLSFLEPCDNRSDFLLTHSLSKLIVLPRISFTGDGETDSTTCAWFIWDKRVVGEEITIVGKPNKK